MSICEDKSVNCIYLEKNSFISIHGEITWLQLLKLGIRVLLYNLQKEHKEEGVFPKSNSTLLRYNTLLRILYWKALQLVFLLISLGRRYITFQYKFKSFYCLWWDPIEILKILGLITDIEEYQKLYNHVWRKHKSKI